MATKPTSKSGGRAKKKTSVRISRDKVVFSLSEADQKRLARCRERGDIRLSFKEVRATKLPQTLVDVVVPPID